MTFVGTGWGVTAGRVAAGGGVTAGRGATGAGLTTAWWTGGAVTACRTTGGGFDLAGATGGGSGFGTGGGGGAAVPPASALGAKPSTARLTISGTALCLTQCMTRLLRSILQCPSDDFGPRNGSGRRTFLRRFWIRVIASNCGPQ